MSGEKIAYIYGQEKLRRSGIFSPTCYDKATTVDGKVETVGGGHVAMGTIVIRELREQGHRIVFDRTPEGKFMPLPEKVKSKLEVALAS